MLPPDQRIPWGPAIRHLAMAVYAGNLPKDTFRRNERIALFILIRNEDSAAPIEFEETFAFRDYRVELIDPSGGRAQLTADGTKAKAYCDRVELIRSRPVELAVQEVYERMYPLSTWYAIAGPGDYEVRVERPDWSENGVALHAPPLRFRVT